jgi:uncharacterized membrane protein YheB (UPF0754 family)
MEYRLILPPLAGALIGWLTNYVAIKLLFRPHNPVKILGFTLQGLIPKRRRDIAHSIATTIERELLSSKDLADTLDTIDWKEEVESAVEEIIENRFSSSTLKKIPLVGLVSENIIYHVKYLITKDILKQIDSKKAGLTKRLSDNVDVRGMLASRIDNLDMRSFEGLLTDFIARELRHIEWLGGAMGFLLGLFQAILFYILY